MSLMGSRGRRASLSDAPQSVQWTHSVQAELDYVGLARAQLLGLSRQHEVIFEGLDVDLTWDLDPRIREEEECCSHEPMENSPRQQSERSVSLWAGTVEAHYDCAAEEPSFQAPSLRMGDADEVEPDAGGLRPVMGSSLYLCPRRELSCSLCVQCQLSLPCMLAGIRFHSRLLLMKPRRRYITIDG